MTWAGRAAFLFSLTLPLTSLGTASAQSAAASDNINRAIAFLKAACVTSGSSLQIRTTSDGSLEFTDASKRSVIISKNEMEGLVDSASEVNAQQASEMRACMKPYIDKIVSSLLGQSAQGSPSDIVISTNGYPFKLNEFDQVIAIVVTRGTGEWKKSELRRSAKLNVARVDLYLDIADRNGLIGCVTDYCYARPKGLAYAISRGLAD